MGCGSSTTPSVVDDLNGVTAATKARVPAARPRHTPDHRNGDHSTGGGEDLPTEILPESVPAAPIKPPLAFEILLEADKESVDGSGLVKMHPPRPPPRLQRGEPSDTPLTLEELQEKMESAERRRQAILQNRIASANKASRQGTRSVMEKQQTIEHTEGENEDDLPQMKTVEELKNTINLEDHSVTLPP